jgi:hypothetical protein
VELPADHPIDLNALDRALTTGLIELKYLRMGPGESMLDDGPKPYRDEAIESFQRALEDEGEEFADNVKAGLAWLLNVDDARFRRVVDRMHVPYPRNDPEDLRKFLLELWSSSWPNEDWGISNFAADRFTISYRKPL